MASEALETHKWLPGQSGNPKGRPKGPSLSNQLLKYLPQQVADIDAVSKLVGVEAETLMTLTGTRHPTWMDVLTVAALLQAAAGNAKVLAEIWNRLEGKIKNPAGDHKEGLGGIFILPGGKNGKK